MNPQPSTLNPQPLLTLEQVAEALQVPKRAVRVWIQTGALAHAKLGERVRVHPADLEDFRVRNTVKAWGGGRVAYSVLREGDAVKKTEHAA